MAGMQTNRSMRLHSPLGEDVLLFRRMTATEHLGRPFEFELDIYSEDHSIKFDQVLGQTMTVELELPGGGSRHFNGLVARFRHAGTHGRFALYHATLRPWLWFLTRTADCRIFQEKTAPDIIKEVFRDHGFTDIEDSLSGSYRTWEYCVQYRETDFNFVSRLMEQEGIYYYFKHEMGKHTLVLADSYSAHNSVPNYTKIPYYPPDVHDRRERDHISSWEMSQEVQPGTYVHTDFNFTRPKANLQAKSSKPRSHAHATEEIYDYPGEYTESGEGQTYARVRLEELGAQFERLDGAGNARGLAVGHLFELTNYPRSDQNREYLVVAATHVLLSDEYSATTEAPEEPYFCSFTAMESHTPYRAPCVTPKPVVQGPQTAMVVGKAGEEIWTDQYGRVKVKFHWDRLSSGDEKSSCWIRVAQIWAGKNWGGMFIPRIGQEVIVDFLEGDPDRPIITGRVYNGDAMPPYGLPDHATRSTVKSNSSKGGGGYNEIRFEDKKGQEEFFAHAQKDMNVVVLNNQTVQVYNNQTIEVTKDLTETVKKGNRTTEISMGNETLTVKMGDQTTKVELGKSSLEAMQSIELKVGASSIKLDPFSITLTSPTIKIAGDMMTQVEGKITKIDGTAALLVSGGIVKIN